MTQLPENGFRSRLRQRLQRLGDKSPSPSNNASDHTTLQTKLDSPFDHQNNVGRQSMNNRTDKAQFQPNQGTVSGGRHEQNLNTVQSTAGNKIDGVTTSSDLWSIAYQEAIHNMKDEIDVAILQGKDIEQLFRDLDVVERQATTESAFMRGVNHLRSLQVPLEKLKLALDLASPLTSLEPTTNMVFGVVRGVTAFAVTLAASNSDFAKQIGDMLDRISWIDDCDTLGQKTSRNDIHKALVKVYQKLLQFYKTAFDLFAKRGPKLIMEVVLETGHLPSIVQDFLTYANALQATIQTATADILVEIRDMVYKQQVSDWLGGAKSSRQDEYDASLRDLRADKACEFLLSNTAFTKWYHSSSPQQLAIFGEMGCGKTVAMGFLKDELSRRKAHQLPQPKLCWYYCRDDETGDAVYIYSALILSLLHQLPGLLKPFVEWYKETQSSRVIEPAKDIRMLEQFLKRLLRSTDRQVLILVDGLDECNTETRDTFLDFLNSLSQEGLNVKTILSSRPQEEILEQLGNTAMIRLGSDPQRDHIIVEKIVERQLRHLSKDTKSLVIEELGLLAQGSAIWTKMVITLLQVKNIRAIGPMRRFLKKVPLPDQLSHLYKALLLRSTGHDTENQELASAALKLLAISPRHFSILELAWAVTLGTSQDITNVDALAERVDHQRVISLISPFIARVDFGDLKKRQVRLLHQSVKEFILTECCSDQACLPGFTLSRHSQIPSGHCLERLEAFILMICIRYLLLDDIGSRDLFSDEQVAIAELPQEFELFDDDEESVTYDPYCSWETWEENMTRYDPSDRGFGELFAYASCHWIQHFGATSNPLPSLASIEALCRAGSTRLRNWIQQNPRPDCTIIPRFEFESCLYDPLSITSLYGSEAILCDMLQQSDFTRDNFLPNTAMAAAEQILRWGDVSRLKILFFDNRLCCQLQTLDFFRLIIKQWHDPNIDHLNWDSVFDLVNDVSKKLAEERWGNELLCSAAGAGCMPIVQRLIINAEHDAVLRNELLFGSRLEQSRSRSGNPTHQSIGEAVLGDHINVVEYLLAKTDFEAHLRYRNSHGENVLHLASKICNPEMFRLLVARFEEGVYQSNCHGDTPLVRVVMNTSASGNRYESARIILEIDTAQDGQYVDGQTDPLRAAVQVSDLDMCRILIHEGNINPVNALTCNSKGEMALKDEQLQNKNNMEQILQLLGTHVMLAQKVE